MFDPATPALRDLIRLMNLPDRPSLETLRSERVDRYSWKSSPVDWKLIFQYPRTVSLAERLGYDV